MPTPNGDVTAVGGSAWPIAVTVFASAARTADPITSTDVGFGVPEGCSGAKVTIVTTASSTPSTVFNVEGYDPASNTWQVLLASAAIAANGTVVLRVFPGATVTANLGANDIIGPRIRVRPVHGNANSHTYSVGILLTGV